jgi:outer membrane protein assembly factor BamA
VDALPASAATSDLYRTRQFFEPVLTFQVSRPLSVSVGASFESFEDQYPDAHTESANAAIGSLRYHQRTEGSDSLDDFDAGYDLRLANRGLGSDMVYARHRWEFRYTWTHGKQVLVEDLTAGMIAGQAPLFERFVLGNSSTLRGWNKYDLDPLGGNRMIHNTVEYRYGAFQIFYDSGAIWDGGQAVEDRNSAGVGLRHGAFSASIAFPLREGRIDPILMLGMNY